MEGWGVFVAQEHVLGPSVVFRRVSRAPELASLTVRGFELCVATEAGFQGGTELKPRGCWQPQDCPLAGPVGKSDRLGKVSPSGAASLREGELPSGDLVFPERCSFSCIPGAVMHPRSFTLLYLMIVPDFSKWKNMLDYGLCPWTFKKNLFLMLFT